MGNVMYPGQLPCDPVRLRRLVSSREQVDATHYHLLNLDALARLYGDEWPRRKRRIFDTCEMFLSKRVGTNGLVVSLADGFLVFLDPDMGGDIELQRQRIQTELSEFFLGSSEFDTVQISSRNVQLAATDLLGRDGSGLVEDAAPRETPIQTQQAASVPGLPYFSLVYRPFWAAASSCIAACLAEPVSTARRHGVRTYHRVLQGDVSTSTVHEFDSAVLARVLCSIEADLSPTACPVIVPVHFSTLVTPRHRQPYLADLMQLPAGTLSNVYLRIVGAPADAPSRSFTEVTRLARACCPRVLFDVDLQSLRLERFADARLDGFLFPSPGPMPGSDWLRRYGLVKGYLRMRGIKLGMLDCHTTRLLRHMVDSQVSFAAGDVFGQPTGTIPRMRLHDPFSGALREPGPQPVRSDCRGALCRKPLLSGFSTEDMPHG
ncbi:hypothetical protein [Maricaulis sp.]|uniref:hypothetical protein n=1 Tax=Maricaulis sp. TaxID=1486257 RepID=UPI0026291FDF|nr:hypothetical protein [Maricaulis sp.]